MKIATYNISHCQDFSVTTDDDAPVNIEKYVQYIKDLDADILLMNEVFLKSAMLDCFDGQTNKINIVARYPYQLEGAGKELPWATIGNVLLSKYPIEKAACIPVFAPNEDERREGETEWYEDRVIISAAMNADGKRFRVLGTHFGLNPLEKERMMNALCSAIDESDLPVIVMGDFNTRPHDEILAPLYEKLTSCADISTNTKHTFPSFAPDRTLDYIFISKDFQLVDFAVREEVLSDHKALTATVTF